HARWIIPVEPDKLVLEHHSVAIQAGRIVALLPTEEMVRHYTANEIHQLTHHAVIPGLINAHTHAAMSLLRGLADDLPLMEWLNNHIWPAEGQWVNYDFVQDDFDRLPDGMGERCG
ncbi:MAG: N-ethylammeline chlorohydrolase, partial [Halothiobacillaceae bacterium]